MVIDYPARYPAFGEAWAERAMASEAGKGREAAIRGLRESSKETLLWTRIRELTCPVLIIRGEPSCGGLLKDEDLARYLEALPHAQIVAFAGSGHDIWNPDKDRYLTTMCEFV
jgi:pimeloyl-ACP methyl ester carboxylesterase